MKKLMMLLACFTALLLWSAGASAFEKTLTLTVADLQAAGVTSLRLTLNIGAAGVTLAPTSDDTLVVQAVVEYDDQNFEPTLQKNSSGSIFFATFNSGVTTGPYFSPPVQQWVISTGSYEVATDVEINFGGVEANLDLGFLPLTKLSLNLGGDDVTVEFSGPTSRSTEQITVNSGGALLTMLNIGNCDFHQFILAGGGLSALLGFHGAYFAGNHEIHLTVGGSIISTIVSLDAGEQVGMLAFGGYGSVSGTGWDSVSRKFFRKEYVTTNYDSMEITLDLGIIAAGSYLQVERDG